MNVSFIKLLIGCVALVLLGVGCGEAALETGYKPHSLTDSPAIRRSYYASPFTPEAQAPAMERDQEFESRRPHQGY